MENQMQVFESSEFGKLEVVMIEGKPHFPATECAKVLGYSDADQAVRRHCAHPSKRRVVSKTTNQYGKTSEQEVEKNFIPEGDLYRLIIRSKLPAAEKFERWVFDEVVPSIRKTGGYIAGQEQMSDDELLAQSVLVAQRVLAQREERIRQLQQQNTVMLPKAEYYDELVDRNLLTNFRDTAKELGVKRRAFVDWLISHHYIYRAGNGKLMPMAKYAGKYFSVKDYINESNGWVGVQTLITVKGKDHFRRLLKDNTELRIKGA